MGKYLYGIIIILFVYFASCEIYKQFNKKTARTSRIECQTKSITFEKVYNSSKISEIKQKLSTGNFIIDYSIIKSKYMVSQINNYIKIDILQNLVRNITGESKKSTLPMKIDFRLYENDKDDPKKKSPKSKLFMGYIRVAFDINNTTIYLIQSDFKDSMGKDIKNRIECIFNSLKSL